MIKGYGVYVYSGVYKEEKRCTVCGAVCDVKRGVCGSTGYISAMGQHDTVHDVFTCPHGGEPWHEHAVELTRTLEKLPKSFVAGLMQLELDELIEEKTGSMFLRER